jgi:hypothetical protein
MSLTPKYCGVCRDITATQVLEGGSDSARVDRMKMVEALELCLKSVADRRSEMMMDDVGHGDIEAWISE